MLWLYHIIEATYIVFEIQFSSVPIISSAFIGDRWVGGVGMYMRSQRRGEAIIWTETAVLCHT